MSFIDRNLARITEQDSKLLAFMVQFGGAFNRWQICESFGYKDAENVRKKLIRLKDLGLITPVDLAPRLPNGPIIYFPTRAYAQNQGCDRRETKDTEQIVEKCYRFYISALHRDPEVNGKNLVNYLSTNDKLPVSEETMEKIKNAHRDEAYCKKTNRVLIDLQSTWPPTKSKNRVLFWARAMPLATLELFCSQKMYADKILEIVTPLVKNKVVSRHRYDPLSATYARNGSVDEGLDCESLAESSNGDFRKNSPPHLTEEVRLFADQ